MEALFKYSYLKLNTLVTISRKEYILKQQNRPKNTSSLKFD